MSFYKDEKKRISSTRWGLLAFFLFLYCFQLMSVVTQYKTLYGIKGADPELIPISNSILFFFCFFLLYYLNQKLFWIKEQGKMVFLPKKYTMVPLSTRQLYGAKAFIMVQSVLIFLVSTVVGYYATLFANNYRLIDYRKNVWEILQIFLFIVIVLLFFWAMDFLQYHKGRKEF